MRARAHRRSVERDFELLYRLHREAVYRVVLRDVRNPDEAEDVTQVAFLDAYRALARGDRPRQPRAWLVTIAQNVARRRHRARAERPQETELRPDLLVVQDEPPPAGAEIRRALALLGPRQREALVLREIAGRSYAEIADDLGVSVGAVETLLFRARRSFREAFEAETPPRAAQRPLGGLLAWSLADAAGRLAGWAGAWTGRSAAAKIAGAASVAALGTGLVVASGPAAPADRSPVVRPAEHRAAAVPSEARAETSGERRREEAGRGGSRAKDAGAREARRGAASDEAPSGGALPVDADVVEGATQPAAGAVEQALEAAAELTEPLPDVPEAVEELPADLLP